MPVTTRKGAPRAVPASGPQQLLGPQQLAQLSTLGAQKKKGCCSKWKASSAAGAKAFQRTCAAVQAALSQAIYSLTWRDGIVGNALPSHRPVTQVHPGHVTSKTEYKFEIVEITYRSAPKANWCQ
ncbi:hypothetical protein COCOBI_08-4510 [Coccomyxa sp. Obi]|nr:hypothetical protein COCOBI_08-4510 [Coccomyxa sp. Obi]